ncbi:MAG: CehA/McbA family metallohydrolase [Verrucomicrobia bacterium]|jgi:hypothetical protein|nr:CehA/McbA family metallohydrolase [Verrucomicrobiota bacterium]MBT5479925.1 CehA/McbA family metallohydrolase [Verrucomicrobiota bacterium]MBT6239646.1 CehA/McbA family metallohydrolase [Verrucomicrobiota bacterium]MBT6806698.1 CehA/McbA family metallohydrolase [Verrucomicrobiota bacterium]MBT7534680.1 CehA/McbA family metallohydrolase [Verrucomicrobiota bacterium]
MRFRVLIYWIACLVGFSFSLITVTAASVPVQPLGEQIRRLHGTMQFLGIPLSRDAQEKLNGAIEQREVAAMESVLDALVLFKVEINPESRVKVSRGNATPRLNQGGYTPFLVKVVNQATVTSRLNVTSPQSGQVFGGMTPLSARRMQRESHHELADQSGDVSRFLDLSFYELPPMTTHLSGLALEYKLLWIYASNIGSVEATIAFDVGQGTQDIGFRSEVPVLFDIKPATKVTLNILDYDRKPSTARLIFRDTSGHVFPPQAKRLAPDFYFQEQIYRHSGQSIDMPPGSYQLEASRGPEYQVMSQQIEIPEGSSHALDIQLERWVNPAQYGFYSGDHHIHGAGCAHYNSPTLGVSPSDMFLQVKGEGLNVGCVLTWGPCFEFQRQFFSADPHPLSDPLTLLKYDLEISGFGSQSMGHVCLLNLKDQTYPGSYGGKDRGWPTWTTPVLKWAQIQGGVVGFAHSASGLQIDPDAASARMMKQLDLNQDHLLVFEEAGQGLLPTGFKTIDEDHDRVLTESELRHAMDLQADRLPNWVVPEMSGVGAMEICVSTALGACDFISAMDTARIPEWNMWYHLLNCGFPLKVSGETDFPCMSGSRVGQGRVYVQLGSVDHLDYADWCMGLKLGRSYVSDGFAHALEFSVNDIAPGFGDVHMSGPATVRIRAKLAFASATPLSVAQGLISPPGGDRFTGDTVTFHGPPPDGDLQGGNRKVELVVNGVSQHAWVIPADGAEHERVFEVPISQSSWVALRQFPQLHTNPVNVIVQDRPIRVSRESALWCAETIHQLWRNRSHAIKEGERMDARRAFDKALSIYDRIAQESPVTR